MKWVGAALVCLMVVAFAAPAAAQPKADVSVGYNYLQVKQADESDSEKIPKGWYADVAGNVTPMVGIVFQVSGNYKTFDDEGFKLKFHTFLFGVRAGSSSGTVRGFGQVLVGGAKLNGTEIGGPGKANETDLTYQVGGGVNIVGSGPVGARIAVDYFRVQAKDSGEVLDGESLNGFRFAVGVTFGVGK